MKKGGNNERRLTVTTTTNYGIEQRRQWLFNSLQLSALEFVCFTCSYRTIGYSLSYSHAFHFFSLQNTVYSYWDEVARDASATREMHFLLREGNSEENKKRNHFTFE